MKAPTGRTDKSLHSLWEARKYCTQLDTLSRQISPKAFCDLVNWDRDRNPVDRLPWITLEFTLLGFGGTLNIQHST